MRYNVFREMVMKIAKRQRTDRVLVESDAGTLHGGLSYRWRMAARLLIVAKDSNSSSRMASEAVSFSGADTEDASDIGCWRSEV